ncbi:MAG: hypothetical protein IIA60_14305 [Candidatus Marinimicrobia bacterium]|nr:hypothetical protein [Candidatus Neomarinimicrobiota bacterium]
MRWIGFIQPDEDDELQEPALGYAEAIASEDDFWDEILSWLITTLLSFFQVYGVIAAAKGVIEYFRG